MATIVIKGFAGTDYVKPNGKVISLSGGSVLNTIDDEDMKYLSSLESFQARVDNGFIIINDKNQQRVLDDTFQETLNLQEQAIKRNEKSNRVKITKE